MSQSFFEEEQANLKTQSHSIAFFRLVGVDNYDVDNWFNYSLMIPPSALFYFRWFCLLNSLISVLVGLLYPRDFLSMLRHPFYFTYLSLYAMIIYFGMTAYHQLWEMNKSDSSADRSVRFYDSNRFSPLKLYLMHLSYVTSFAYQIVVPLVYWTILHRSDLESDAIDTWLNYATHVIPIILLFLEFIFNGRCFIHYADCLAVAVIGCVYMVWTWLGALIHYLTFGKAWWVYHFMAWEDPKNAYYHLGILALMLVAAIVVKTLHMIKAYVCRRMLVI